MLLWAGNTVAGRMAVGEVSPMMVVFLRWIIASSAILLVAGKPLQADWPILRTRLAFVAIMGTLGYTVYNVIFYMAAHHTTAVKMSISQGALPVFVLAGAIVILRAPTSPLQLLGALITMIGVALVASEGDLTTLKDLSLNPGDTWMIFASLLYAGYTIGLRSRPKVSGLGLFAAMGIAATIATLPFLAYELITGTAQWPTLKGWFILLYIGLCPSFIAQLGFMRGVELVGPGRAGVFYNLIPVLGALLAVLILNEPFHLYHGAALVLVLGGIYLAERFARK
jgi:drug/metabolite transporter (DMT)-like permease